MAPLRVLAHLAPAAALLLLAACGDADTPAPPPDATASADTADATRGDEVSIRVYKDQAGSCLYDVDGMDKDSFDIKANKGNSNKYKLRIIPDSVRARVHVMPDGDIAGVKNDNQNPQSKTNGSIVYHIRSQTRDSVDTQHEVRLWCCGGGTGNLACPDSVLVADTITTRALRVGGPVMRVEN